MGGFRNSSTHLQRSRVLPAQAAPARSARSARSRRPAARLPPGNVRSRPLKVPRTISRRRPEVTGRALQPLRPWESERRVAVVNTCSTSAHGLDPGASGYVRGLKLNTGTWESSPSPCQTPTGSGIMDGSSVCLRRCAAPRGGQARLPETRGQSLRLIRGRTAEIQAGQGG